MDYLERARRKFAGDIYATETTGIIVEAAGRDYAKCSLETGPQHMNAASAVMGGAIFTLADFTFAVAANSEEMNTVSLTSSITYLSAARGGKLTAEANCVRSGRNTCHFIVTVTDSEGRVIASVSTTGFRK
ncbi:MAG: PaaI family thioesterase [Ruminococcaceae bacterium]|nr:PaaI family thioesterase [Oscillospiraceae bacterium]